MAPSLMLLVPVAVPAALLLASTNGHAQVAEGLLSQDHASGGKTDVADEGFAAAAAEPSEEKSKDATELKLSAGGMISYGNSRLIALTGSSGFRFRQNASQLSLTAAVNVSRAETDPDQGMQTTVENYQGKARYDYFLGKGFALFLAVSARRDRFQGLDLRLNLDPGLAYYFVDEEAQRFWAEIGYDLQYDVRRDANLAEAEAAGERLDKTDLRHSGRGFVGYEEKLNQAVTISTGLEYLQGIPDTDYWRLNWDAAVNSALHGALSISTTLSLRYDNHPLPGIEKTDVVTAFNLVYQAL